MWAGIAKGAGALAGGLTGGLSGYFGAESARDAANKYNTQMNSLANTFSPYQQRGWQLENQSAALNQDQMNHPAALQNMLASSYKSSPYQNEMMTNLRNQMNTNAAQTGLLNSTAQQAALQHAMGGMQNQFQQQYINRGIQQYNQGFGGFNQLAAQAANRGYNALGTEAQLRAQGNMAQYQQGMQGSPWAHALSGAAGGGMGVLSMFT